VHNCIFILNIEVHGPPRLLWTPERRIGCNPLSWSLSRNSALTLLGMVGPGQMSVGLGTFAMTRTKQHLITLRLL